MAMLTAWAFLAAGMAHATLWIEGYEPSIRAAGMGRAFTAVAEGPAGIWWNPGGLGIPQPPVFGGSFQRIQEEDGDNLILSTGFVTRSAHPRFGFSGAFSRQRFGQGTGESGRRGEEKDFSGVAGWGVALPLDGKVRMGLGASVKGAYTDLDYTFLRDSEQLQDRIKVHRFDGDAGLLLAGRFPLGNPARTYPSYLGVRLGAAARDLFESRAKSRNETGGDRDSEARTYPRRWAAGGALELALGSKGGYPLRIIGSAERMAYFRKDPPGDLIDARTPIRYLGAEMNFFILSGRIGRYGDEGSSDVVKTWGVSLNLVNELSAVRRQGLSLDFATWTLPGQIGKKDKYQKFGLVFYL